VQGTSRAILDADRFNVMQAFENISAFALLAAFAGAVVFSLLSAFSVDPDKRNRSTARIQKWGPMVSESVLTDRGGKFARWRNISVLVLFGATIGFTALKAFVTK
jgi:hypothetical protein